MRGEVPGSVLGVLVVKEEAKEVEVGGDGGEVEGEGKEKEIETEVESSVEAE